LDKNSEAIFGRLISLFDEFHSVEAGLVYADITPFQGFIIVFISDSQGFAQCLNITPFQGYQPQ
jgi:hypothetical protein